MILELPPFSDDDIHFLLHVERIVRGVTGIHTPPYVQVHRVDNWFGDKWLQFAGKALGALGIWDRHNAIVPPFVPNRITAQSHFVSGANNSYQYDGNGIEIHLKRPSRDNLVNRVRQTIPNTGLFWFSGNTKQNARGGIMGYTPCSSGFWGWYLGFARNTEWQICKQVNFHDTELAQLKERSVQFLPDGESSARKIGT